jgi:hypothetical protein
MAWCSVEAQGQLYLLPLSDDVEMQLQEIYFWTWSIVWHSKEEGDNTRFR